MATTAKTRKPKDPVKEAAKRREQRFKPRYMLRLDDEQYDRLRTQAFLEHRTQTEIIRDGLNLYLARATGQAT